MRQPLLLRLAAALALATAALALPEPAAIAQLPEPALFGPDDGHEIERPEHARRLVYHWAFEDRETTLEPVPRHWFRSLHAPEAGSFRPGFPRWNLAELDDEHAAGGRWSLKLPTSGGSASLVLARGVAPAMPDADLLVTCRVRTEGLEHAAARIAGRFLDDDLNPIPGRYFTSEALRTEGKWETASLRMRAGDDSAWIQLELLLLQPAQLSAGSDEPYRVDVEDVSGAAWFDDLRVFQVPRIKLSTNAAGNVIAAPDRPAVELSVLDLTGEDLTATLTAYDASGEMVATVDRAVSALGRPIRWTPPLTEFGWYRVVVWARATDETVGVASADLAWLPEPSARAGDPEPRLGVRLTRREGETLDLLPMLLEKSGSSMLLFDVWSRADPGAADGGEGGGKRRGGEGGMTPAAEDPAFASLVERVLEDEHEVTFVLERVPRDLARSALIDSSEALHLLSGDESAWLSRLRPLLTRFGERVRRWQVGVPPASTDLPRAAPHRDADAIHRTLFKLIPRPVVVLPWRLTHPFPDRPSAPAPEETAEGGRLGPLGVATPTGSAADALTRYEPAAPAVTFSAPSALPPASVAAMTDAWPTGDGHTLLLETLDAETFGRLASATDLAQRVIHAWRAGAGRVAIDAPWTWTEPRLGGAAPTVAFPVWRTLSSVLTGSEPVGELPVSTGVTALIAQPRRPSGVVARSREPGKLIAWADAAPPERARVRGFLGREPVVVRDLFGNTHRPARFRDEYDIPLTGAPVFIENVDTDLLRFRSALRVEPAFLETRAMRHAVSVVVENPWSTPISGRLRLAGPDDWEVQPRVFHFTLQPGETRRLPASVTISLGEEAGSRALRAQVDLRAEEAYPVLDLPVPVEVGLRSLELSASYAFVPHRPAPGEEGVAGEADEPAGDDLILTVVATNVSDRPITMEAFAHAPGYPLREATISSLEPSHAAIRRFRFEHADPALLNQRVRIGLRERDNTGRLNTSVLVR